MTDKDRLQFIKDNYAFADMSDATLDLALAIYKDGVRENEARLEGCHNCPYMADRCDNDEAHCVKGDRYVRLLEKQNNELKTMLEKLLEKMENGN